MAEGSGLQIHNALDLPQHVPQMARWIHDAFWATDPDWTPAYIESRIAEADDPAQLPLARLALLDSVPAGTASLIACDDRDRAHLSPWLAAVMRCCKASGSILTPEQLIMSSARPR